MISSENALLVIDMQHGLFRGPRHPISQTRFCQTSACFYKKPGKRKCQSFLPVTPVLTIPPSLSKVP